VFVPPGETHTLVAPEGVAEMITYFQVNGVMYYVDPWGKAVKLTWAGFRRSGPRRGLR
jgi:2,4'-dihydroxyacetophenone dioxygenase